MTIKARITEAGGLLNQADIARLFDVSAERARQLVNHPTFPAPVADGEAAPGGRAVWLQSEVVDWRRGRS